MFTGKLAWQPGEIAGNFVFEPAKLGNDFGEIRVVAWKKGGEICVRGWKSSLCSRGNSCGSLEEERGNLSSSLE